MRTAAVIFSLAAMAGSSCPSACSGNGICGAQGKCSCFQNWQSADCSARTCPSTLAWADTADGTNQAHYYAECGNKGICDRKSGECKCFDGHEGKGCRRSTCPGGCSGHGTCEYIEELARDFDDRRNGPGNKYQDLTCTDNSPLFSAGICIDADGNEQTVTDNAQTPPSGTCNSFTNCCSALHGGVYTPPSAGNCGTSGLVTTLVTARSANTDKHSGHQYNLWDAGKIQGCKCDLGYEGAGCSTREVPRGDGPLTTVKATTMKQSIVLAGAAAGDQFFLNYYGPYGGKWTTSTITAVDVGTADGDVSHAKLIEDELSTLPNEVLVGVKVKATSVGSQALCHRFYDGVQHISAYSESTGGNFKDSAGTTSFCKEKGGADGLTNAVAADTIDVTVEFADSPGQTGVQYLLEVDTAASGAGSYPASAGGSGTSTVAEINYNDNLGNLSELSSCSDRGLDNGDGECECFDGFRGLACEEQEALV